MSSIYSCSSINIAATSASDGNGGCFFTRDPRRVWRYRISTSVHGLQKYYEAIEDGGWDTCLPETPLARRAWVLQERLLAPRTLHFSKTQLFWECNAVTACEIFQDKFPDALRCGDFHLNKQPISRSLWPRIVKIYSRCDLSFSRDKLVAISRIAQTIQVQNADDKYLAGLWRQDMEEQLCWQVRVRRPRVSSTRAPSWSWASVDGTIDYAVPSKDTGCIEILDVDLGPRDPFGEVPEGRLPLACSLLFNGTFDSTHDYVRFGTSQYHVRTCLDDLGMNTGTVLLLPVLDSIRSGSKCWRGLLLQATNHPAEYRRIGCFEFDNYDKVYDFLVHNCQTQSYQSRDRRGDRGNMGRMITIV
jgi:Heterokaryon incompatibility protein (HET)